MSKTDPSSRSDQHSRPLLTLQISQRFGWTVLGALALIAALIVVDIQQRRKRPPAPAPIATQAENSPSPTPSVPAVREVVAKSEPKPDPPIEDNSVKIASSTVNIHPESSPIAVIVQPAATVSETEVSSANVMPVEATVIGATGPVSLNGAGATFPYPLYAKWFSEFRNVDPDSRISYQAIGSGGGIRQLLAGTVDFGASDAPMSDQQLAQAHIKIFHIPTVLGAVVPIYNLPGVGDLRFTPEILAGIFLGKITSWNHPAIVRANPQANLPDQPIIVVHRSDGNGETLIFTDYLSKVSSEWSRTVGKGTSVKWPIGLGGKGEEGLAGAVRQSEGAIGYVDLIYALLNDVPFGSVRNASGNFVKADLGSLTEAGASVHEMPADFRVSITNAPGHGAYPISSFTWLLVPQRMRDADRGLVMASFLRWMIDDGESMTKKMGYAPLPQQVAAQVRKSLRQLH